MQSYKECSSFERWSHKKMRLDDMVYLKIPPKPYGKEVQIEEGIFPTFVDKRVRNVVCPHNRGSDNVLNIGTF